MLFAVDIVLVDESRDGMNPKLKRWREALDSKGFIPSPTKPKCTNCNFSGEVQRDVTQ